MKNRLILLQVVFLFLSFNVFANQPVTTTKLEKRAITRETRQPIELMAVNSADIGTRVSGYVKEVLVDIGDTVKGGDLLALIDAPELAAGRRMALAEQMRISLQVESAKADLEAVKAEDARIQKLVQSQSLSDKVSLESKSNVAAAEAKLAWVEAEQEIASAKLDVAEALLGFAELRAPFTGKVTGRFVDVGDMVTAEAGTLFVVEDTSVLRAVAYVPERDAVLVNLGDAVTITLDAFPGKSFDTKVSRLSMTVGLGDAQRMRVEADIGNSDDNLPTGLYGSARITLEKRNNAILAPAGAVRFGEDPVCVYVVEGGILRHRPVTVGLDDGQWLEITSGLTGNESVVVNLLGRIADGTPVSVK